MSGPDSSSAYCDPQLLLDNQFCFVLYALSRRITALYRPLLQEIGLTYPQYLALLVLWEAEANVAGPEYAGVPIRHLGQRLLLDTGTLTPLLKRLEAMNLVQRNRSREDEREVRIRLTPAGTDLKDKARHIPLQMICNSKLPLERIEPLQRELKSLLDQVASED